MSLVKLLISIRPGMRISPKIYAGTPVGVEVEEWTILLLKHEEKARCYFISPILLVSKWLVICYKGHCQEHKNIAHRRGENICKSHI